VDRGGRTTLVGGAAGVLGGGLVASMTRNVLVLLLVLALAAPAGADLCTANVGGSPVACKIRKPEHPRFRIARDTYGVPHMHQLATGQGQADPHMGDQAELFRTFAYKPMVLR